MEILAIESSGPLGSLALWRDGRLVDVRRFRSERVHNSLLFAPLQALWDQAEGPDLLVCGTGPGSYSGVRVGIAAAIGLSVARDIPLIGWPSPAALPEAAGLDRYAVTGDARRGSWWWGVVENGRMDAPPEVASADATAGRAEQWCGRIFTLDPVSPPFCRATPAVAAAEILAATAAGLSPAAVDRLAAQPVEPVYLGAPFITQSKQPVFA